MSQPWRDWLAGCRVPHASCPVSAGCHHQIASMTKPRFQNLMAVSQRRSQRPTRSSFPDASRVVFAGCNHTLTVRTETDSHNAVAVAQRLSDLVAGLGVPDLCFSLFQ